MKKSIIIAAVVLLGVLVLLVTVPFFFKPALVKAAKTSLSKHVNAKVEFGKFRLSLFRNFPNVTFEIHNVSLTGTGEFENDTFLFVNNARAEMNLNSLFRKSQKQIESIHLFQPRLNLIVSKTGSVNWDVETDAQTEPVIQGGQEVAKEDIFTLHLNKIDIENGSIVYQDREIELLQLFDGVHFTVNGKMYGSSAELEGTGKVERYSLTYESVRYISQISLETNMLLNIDYEKMDINIIENELLVNRLPMQVKGLIQMPSDSTFFDLTIKTKDSEFDNFLALLPPGYDEYLKKIETKGSASFSGTVNGLYFGEIYPALDLAVEVANGNIKYEGLPEEIKNIKASISIKKPQGIWDLTEVKIKNAHIEIKNNPVDLTLLLKNPVTDPWFDGAFVGTINFEELKNALPLDSVNVSGTIDANLFVQGNYSSVENEEYDKIKSDGIVYLDNFSFDSPNLTQRILVPGGKLDFSAQYVNLSQFNMIVGQSDFNLSGKVFNYLNYIFKDGVLKGDLQLVSSFVNLNELFRLQRKEIQKEVLGNKTAQTQVNGPVSENREKLVFDVPRNMDMVFRSNIDKAVFDKLPISNIKGTITAKNGKLILNGLMMNMVEGELKLTGSYENTPQNQPFVDLGLEMIKFDIPVAYRSLTGFQKLLPIAGQSQGKISTVLTMKGQLTPSFKIIPATVDGNGHFNTENLRIIDSPVFNQLKGILLPEKLRNVEIDDFRANFIINKGNIDLKPFKTRVAGQETTVFGTLSAESMLNMKLDFKVNRNAFGTDIQNILSVIPGNDKITVLPAGVNVNGPVGKPEVKVDLSEARKTVTNAAKDGIQDSLNKLGKGIKKLLEK